MDKIKKIPVILAYDTGFAPEDLAEFVKSIMAFRLETQEQYKGQEIEYHFMPKEIAENYDEFMEYLKYKKSLEEQKNDSGSN